MDGSTDPITSSPAVEACWEAGHAIAAGHDGHWVCIEDHNATQPNTVLAQLTASLKADMAEQHATDVRPVMPVVARTFDLDAIDDLAAAGDRLLPGEVRPLIAEVRRLQAAVGKVAELHVDNGCGFCRACHVVAPCATAVAIGAGQ